MNSDDTWLEPWMDLIRTSCTSKKILELGCDTGRDTKVLTDAGFSVTGTDISEAAILECTDSVPSAKLVRHDLNDSFPFSDGEFEVILASLSLHYFSWAKTLEVFSEVHRCLGDGGLFICRLNSTRDINHGAEGFEAIEPNYYRVNARFSELKRFFDRASVDAVFAKNWDLISCKEVTIYRYEKPKCCWEIIARKR